LPSFPTVLPIEPSPRYVPPRLLWVSIAVAALVADFFTGPVIQFPVFYVLPVGFAAWYAGIRWGLTLALLMPVARLSYFDLWDPPWTFTESVINALIRMAVLSTIAVLLARVASHTRRLQTKVELLEGLLPVCVYCKRIHDDDREWEPIEEYVAAHTEVDFEHTVCPQCKSEVEDWATMRGRVWVRTRQRDLDAG
jgi:hypothetical protein